jgi:hypothetical protein
MSDICKKTILALSCMELFPLPIAPALSLNVILWHHLHYSRISLHHEHYCSKSRSILNLEIQWGLGSQTPRFTNKFSEQKTSRMTNGFKDYEHASWQQRQAESISAGVSCWLTLAQYTSLLDFSLRRFRFTNGLQERIKFVNRGPTVSPFIVYLVEAKTFSPPS